MFKPVLCTAMGYTEGSPHPGDSAATVVGSNPHDEESSNRSIESQLGGPSDIRAVVTGKAIKFTRDSSGPGTTLDGPTLSLNAKSKKASGR
jgi:hypothetical protein